jgi:hypothetical protein
LRGLKILVIGLGVAVVIAFLTLVAVIFNRGGAPADAAAQGARARPPVGSSWGRVVADSAPGARIQSITASGNLIVLQVYTQVPGQDERLIVLDPATGAVNGVFHIGTR